MFRRDKIEKEFIRLYDRIGLGTTTWSPLASGLLTGKYNDGIPEKTRMNLDNYEWLRKNVESEEGKKKIEKVRKLTKVAEDIGISMPDLALAWLLKNPNVSTVITGASKPEQVKQNMKVIDKVDKLTPEVMKKVEDILDNKPKSDTDFREA